MSERTELTADEKAAVAIGEYKYGFHDEFTPFFQTGRGLTEEIVRQISAHKSEPEWMTRVPRSRATGTSSTGRCRGGAATST